MLAERYRVLELHKARPELTWRELGDLTNVSHETARLTCIAAGRNAVELMSAFAAPMVEDWAQASHIAAARGDHRPARDWLLHAGIIEPLPDGRQYHGPNIVIVNNPLPGMPGAELRVLEPHTLPDTPHAFPDTPPTFPDMASRSEPDEVS